jgi:spore coat polysaccharide biosynthesis predicted glycosyltransferase SpsG
VNFYTHGTSVVGFGHMNRCVKLASEILSTNSEVKINFEGVFEDGAKNHICSQVNSSFEENVNADVCVYDRMDCPENPEFVSLQLIEGVESRSKSVIFLANGFTVPKLNQNVVVVGYKGLSKAQLSRSDLFWGPQYVPISRDIQRTKISNPKALSIALGGGENDNLVKVFNIITKSNCFDEISVLLTPKAEKIEFQLKELARCSSCNVQFFKRLNNVSGFLSASSVVVCSYGHLAYEAISLGSHVVLLAQKEFQFKYGAILEKLGLVNNFPVISNIDGQSFLSELENLFRESSFRKTNGNIKIDNLGISRIAAIIETKLNT